MADQLAVLTILRNETLAEPGSRASGELVVYAGAAALLAFANVEEPWNRSAAAFAWWNVHRVDLARAYNVMCWGYGLSPEQLGFLLKSTADPGDPHIPLSRAARCPDEAAQFSSALDTLLAPHVRASHQTSATA